MFKTIDASMEGFKYNKIKITNKINFYMFYKSYEKLPDVLRPVEWKCIHHKYIFKI